MPFNHDQFIADFKKEWQQIVIKRLLLDQPILNFKLHGDVARLYNRKVTEVMHFTKFLEQIGFLTVRAHRVERVAEWIPKNQK